MPDSPAVANNHVLVLEDDTAIRRIWCSALSKSGYFTHEAGSVAAALDILSIVVPAVCVIDRNLPGDKTGDDFVEMGAHGNAVAFIVTASNFDESYEVEMLNKGMRFVLRKPISIQKLLACVKEASKLYHMRAKLLEFRALVSELQSSIDGAVDDVKKAIGDSRR